MLRDDGTGAGLNADDLARLTGELLMDAEVSRASADLQHIIDELGHELSRPASIDDRHFRQLVHTQHRDEMDDIRLASILGRELPQGMFDWIEQHNLRNAEEPVRLPPNDTLPMDARVCAPIRCSGHLFGYLWVTDRDQSVTDDDLQRLKAVADGTGVAMYRDLLLLDINRSRERELARDLLSDDEGMRRHAAEQLVELEVLSCASQAVVLVIPFPTQLSGDAAQQLRITVDVAINRVRRPLVPKHALHLLRPDHALLVAMLVEPSLRRDGVTALAERVRVELEPVFEPHGVRALVAMGGEVAHLYEARASYEQALRTVQVSEIARDRFGDVVSWGGLGIYRLLADLPLEGMGPEVIHPGLRALIDDPRKHFLVHTLETYLDHAGDVQATAATLFLHRTTLYNRLSRIEQTANVSLRSGEDRLTLHIGLRIARLKGLTWSA